MWLLFFGIIIFVVLVITFLIYLKVFYSPYKKQNELYNLPNERHYNEKKEMMIDLIKRLDDVPCQIVCIKSYDGLTLYGRLYLQNPSSLFDICFHGYRGTGVRDFSGGAKLLLELGHNVLIVDQRCHGKSQGHTITFGSRESNDVKKWVEYVNISYKPSKIILYGVSMGATTVLLASEYHLTNVVGIVADCPFSSSKKIIKKVCNDMSIPSVICYPFIFLSGIIFGRFNISKADCKLSVIKSNVPILIIHGEDDNFVPKEMSEDIQKANQDMITRYTFDNAGHGLSLIEDYDRYKKIIEEFLTRV